MHFDIKKLTAASALAVALIAGPALAQGMMDWDTDADGMFSEDEFNTGFSSTGNFGAWDPDTDGTLDEAEFSAGYGDTDVGAFSDWDSSGDGLIDETEYNAGNFRRYDADQSGFLEESESGLANDDFGDDGLFNM